MDKCVTLSVTQSVMDMVPETLKRSLCKMIIVEIHIVLNLFMCCRYT